MNSKTLEAIVEGGVLRPLEELSLPEHQHVLVKIVALKQDARDEALSCFDLAQELGVIGAAGDTPRDLSSSPAHLQDFGAA